MSKPGKLTMPNGDKYRPTVLLITSRTPNGLPHECRIIHDDETVQLKGGEEFAVVYILEKLLEPAS